MIWGEETSGLYLHDALYDRRDTRLAINVEAWAARRRKESTVRLLHLRRLGMDYMLMGSFPSPGASFSRSGN